MTVESADTAASLLGVAPQSTLSGSNKADTGWQTLPFARGPLAFPATTTRDASPFDGQQETPNPVPNTVAVNPKSGEGPVFVNS